MNAIRLLLTAVEKARDMGKRAKKLVLEHCTWEVNAQQYVAVYRELVGHDE